MLWISNGIHPIYIPIKVQMFFTLYKPCVMFPFNFLPLLLQLSFLWRCHLWYFLPLLPHLSLLWNCQLWYFLYSLNCPSYGNVIYGTSAIYLATYTIIGTAYTTIGTTYGSTLTFIIFCAIISMLSCSFFILKLDVPLSSTLLFFLKTLLNESAQPFLCFPLLSSSLP